MNNIIQLIKNKQFLKDALIWGFLLWLIGYALGFVFFAFVPATLLGWVIMPIGTAIALWVLIKKIKGENLGYYFKVAIVWVIIAMVFDYFFLVKMLKPEDGYYKLDVYLYYVLTFILPIAVGWFKIRKSKLVGEH